jgi:hypothetical protein
MVPVLAFLFDLVRAQARLEGEVGDDVLQRAVVEVLLRRGELV